MSVVRLRPIFRAGERVRGNLLYSSVVRENRNNLLIHRQSTKNVG